MARTCGTTGEYQAGCSKRPFSKAAASKDARRTLRYVELLSEARTKLAGFFSILPTNRETVFLWSVNNKVETERAVVADGFFNANGLADFV